MIPPPEILQIGDIFLWETHNHNRDAVGYVLKITPQGPVIKWSDMNRSQVHPIINDKIEITEIVKHYPRANK